MTEEEIREKVLKLFQNERQNPNEKFNKSHFLDFLTSPPHSKNSIKNSFKGVKRYYRFMEVLELEFKICFTLSDLDRYYSIDSLTKKIIERIDKKRGNLKIIKMRNEEENNFWLEISLSIIIIMGYIWLGIHWLSIGLTIIFGIIIRWTLISKLNVRKHNKKMTKLLINK